MAALEIPAGIGFQAFTPSLLYAGRMLEGAAGGPDQWVDRLGDRYMNTVKFPEMKMEPLGRILIGTLKLAKKAGLLVPIPQDGLIIGTPGTVRVKGAGQTGMSLEVDGFTPGYAAKFNQFFVLMHGGRRYLHSLAADVTATGAGEATLPLIEPLRVIPDDNDICRFTSVFMEGYPLGEATSWDVGLEPNLKPLTIQVREAR